jgi:hypothetical protein
MIELTKTTSHKFYNKWLYKISINQKGSAFFRNNSVEKIIEFCNNGEPNGYVNSLQTVAYNNKDGILELAKFFKDYDTAVWSKRIEGNSMDVYTNDSELYDKFSTKFKDIIIHRFEPDHSSIDQLTDEKIIVCKKLPHKIYQYKVYLLPHKMQDREEKRAVVEWLKKQKPKVTCTPAVERWFIKTDWNWDRRYILVQDEQSLLMLKLRAAEVIGRIYNYVISDK